MTARNRRGRGQGTLEYVLIFALIAIVLIVAGYLMRQQLKNLANDAIEKLQTFIKDPSTTAPATGGTAAPEDPYGRASKASPGGGPATGKGEQGKASVKTSASGDAPPAPEQEPSFSFQSLLRSREVIAVAGVIGVVMAVVLFLRQAKQA